MSMIFLATGTCQLGVIRRDKDGHIVEESMAQFIEDDIGGSVAVGEIDPQTKEVKESTVSIYGDWQAADYLREVLEHINPRRAINIPDFKAIIQAAYREDGCSLVCDYCKGLNCMDCIVKEWLEEET
jgi:hypothetical protein